MAKNRSKEQFMAQPIEKHETAAWANISEVKPISCVAIPNEEDVRNAKEWVDSNQK